jgi:hypothetical protein
MGTGEHCGHKQSEPYVGLLWTAAIALASVCGTELFVVTVQTGS